MPHDNCARSMFDVTLNSPRRNLIYQAAASTLKDVTSPARWQSFKQPLPLILQTFQEMTDNNEDFWFKACPYFQKMEFVEGVVLFHRGVRTLQIGELI